MRDKIFIKKLFVRCQPEVAWARAVCIAPKRCRDSAGRAGSVPALAERDSPALLATTGSIPTPPRLVCQDARNWNHRGNWLRGSMIHIKENLFDSSAELLSGAESVVVFTGAGMSKESGIPTFRDALEGIWGELLPRRPRHPGGVRARSAAGAGFLRIPPRIRPQGQTERRASGHRRDGGAFPGVHRGPPERGLPARGGRKHERHQPARRNPLEPLQPGVSRHPAGIKDNLPRLREQFPPTQRGLVWRTARSDSHVESAYQRELRQRPPGRRHKRCRLSRKSHTFR